jgi:hypothetical protein
MKNVNAFIVQNVEKVSNGKTDGDCLTEFALTSATADCYEVALLDTGQWVTIPVARDRRNAAVDGLTVIYILKYGRFVI